MKKILYALNILDVIAVFVILIIRIVIQNPSMDSSLGLFDLYINAILILFPVIVIDVAYLMINEIKKEDSMNC